MLRNNQEAVARVLTVFKRLSFISDSKVRVGRQTSSMAGFDSVEACAT